LKVISLTYKYIGLINAPKIHTNLLWDLTILFGGIGIVYFTIIFFFRNKLRLKSKNRIQKKKELISMVSEFLFYKEEETKDKKSNYVNLRVKIKEATKDKLHREIVLEILLDLQKNVSGHTQKRLFKLYKDLGLHLDALEKLNSWHWEIISKGIFELTQMQVNEAYGFLTKYINDRRSVVRKQAEIAIVTLKEEGINYLLDNTHRRISKRQQLNLLEIIRNREDCEIPSFKEWITSNNKDVVLFSLRLIKHYNQNCEKESVIELVKHKNKQIKIAALDCIKKFHISEAIDTLKVVFWKSSVNIKLQILEVMSSLGTEKDIYFLKNINKKEINFNVKSRSLSIVNTISNATILKTEGVEEFARKLDDLEKNTVDKDFWDDKRSVEKAISHNLKISLDKIEKITEDILNEDTSEILALDDEVYIPVFDDKDILASAFLPIVIDYDIIINKKDIIDNDIKEVIIENTGDESSKEELLFTLIEEELKDYTTKNSVKTTNDDDSYVVETDFDKLFFSKDIYNKTLLLDTIEDAKNKKDIPLLKEILNKENNKLIKGRAWEILKCLSREESHYIVNNNNTRTKQEVLKNSIFINLFKVSDVECKLMLLDEIAQMADAKEIVFLNTLLTDSNKGVKTKATIIITQLKEREARNKFDLEIKETIESDIDFIINKELKPLKAIEFNADEILSFSREIVFKPIKNKVSNIKKEEAIYNVRNSRDLIPLEFCFLLGNLGIELPKPFSVFDVDFEINKHDFIEENKDKKQTKTIKEKQSVLAQIFSLVLLKMRNKLGYNT